MEFRGSADALGWYGWFGFRPPVANEDDIDAVFYGFFSDFDRLDAFLPNQFSLVGGGGWRGEISNSADASIQFHVGLGGVGLLATEENDDSEFFAKGHVQFWYVAPQFSGFLAYSAVAWVTSDNLSFSELMESQLTLGVRANLGQVSPGAFIRFPVEEGLNDILSFVGGVNLLFNLPSTK